MREEEKRREEKRREEERGEQRSFLLKVSIYSLILSVLFRLHPSSLYAANCSRQMFQCSCSRLDCERFVIAKNLGVRNMNLTLAQQSHHLSARGDRGTLLENLAQCSSALHLA